uniref:acylneuraminate cytidylyltransferase family protein n=1 Tax=Algoriphagus sp. TaxID=1872435 RepID=UPI004047B12F
MNFLIMICARGGSKGIPGKNIKDLNGLPLIAYSINHAKKFASEFGNAVIALSTDSSEIREIAAKHGLNTAYNRADFLSGDEAGKIDVIRDLLLFEEKSRNVRFDYVLDLDVTSPLRNLNDLQRAYEIIRDNEQTLTLFSVSPSARSPYFNMVEIKEDGYYSQVKSTAGTLLTRQSAPLVYDLNASFYFYRRSFFDLGYKGVITDKSLIYIVPHLCFDLDHLIDFEFLAYLLANNKLDFEL